MTRVGDVLSVLHQVDTLRGKVCAACKHWQRRGCDCHGEPTGHCSRGHEPMGWDDGCDDWRPISNGCTKVLK